MCFIYVYEWADIDAKEAINLKDVKLLQTIDLLWVSTFIPI